MTANSASIGCPNSASISARASLRREWRQPVLQRGEVGGDLVAEQVGAGRKHLPELDEARAQFVERGGEPFAGTGSAAPFGCAGRCARHEAAAPRQSAGRAETARHGAPASRRSGRGGRDCGNRGSDRTRLRNPQEVSDPPSRMKRGDAAGQVAVSRPLEARGRDHRADLSLRRKAADALDQIGVGVTVSRHRRPSSGRNGSCRGRRAAAGPARRTARIPGTGSARPAAARAAPRPARARCG